MTCVRRYTAPVPPTRLPLLATVLTLASCVQTADQPDTGVGGGGDDAGASSCDSQVVETWPADGATDVWLQPRLEVLLDPPDPGADLRVIDPDGGRPAAAPAVLDGGGFWRLDLDQRLEPGTAYTFEVEHCNGTRIVRFTTVDSPGGPDSLDDPRAYSFQPLYGRLVTPDGLDRALAPLWPDHPWLLSLWQTKDGVGMRMGAGSGAVQNTCIPTQELPTAHLEDDLHLTLGPTSASLGLEPGSVTLHDLVLAGTFAFDGGEIAGLELETTLDARDLVALGLLGDSVEEVCEELARDGVSCEACADGTQACVDARWDSWTASYQELATVEEITHLNCHPDCTASYTNPLCDTSKW